MTTAWVPTTAQFKYANDNNLGVEEFRLLLNTGRLNADGKLMKGKSRAGQPIANDRGHTWNPVDGGCDPEDEQPVKPFTTPKLVNLATVTPQVVEWLWPRRIPLGKLTVVAGDPGLGKSQFSLDVAAIVTTGGLWPDGMLNTNCGSVVLISAEDDVNDTIAPRLIAAGAELDKINAIQSVEFRVDDSTDAKQRTFNLEQDLPVLEQAIDATPNCRLVVIDPVGAFLGKTDSHRDADLRGLLAPLAELASRRKLAVLAVMHLNKSTGSKAMNRITGSLAFVAAARAAWLVAADPADPKRRLFLQIKNNLAKDPGGLAFTIREGENDAPCLAWEKGTVTTTADEALSDQHPKRKGQAEAQAVAWLYKQLSDGPVTTTSIKDAIDAAGFSWSTIRRASEKLKVESFKSNFAGGWSWRLPVEEAQEPLSPDEMGTFDE